jgi:2',3'-cyclic-nucleotide 2'-phosphodiesterase (5'-nucleotidase family)
MLQFTAVLAAVFALLTLAAAFDLTVLHTNDIHSRFDEVTSRGSVCRPKDREGGKCFGGVARIKHVVSQIRNECNKSSNMCDG